MRVALISLIERAEDDPATPLAALALAGRTLGERQLELALALGCERIVCLSQGLDRGLIALQHRAEAAGAKFNLVSGPRPLAGLVNAADELVVVADGLLPAISEATAAMAGGAGVLVLPVEAGLAAGLERIDLNHAWAGLLAMPGGLVERLNQLPPDCDPISALLRIALQGRVALRNLPEAVLSEHRWGLITGHGQIDELEPEWLRRHAAQPSVFAPGRAAARLLVRRAGSSLLAKGWRPWGLTAAAVACAGMGIAAAWLALPLAGILLCALGWMVLEGGQALSAIDHADSGADEGPDRIAAAASYAVDCAFIAVLAFALAGSWTERFYPPLILLGMVRIGGGLIGAKWAEFIQDRALLALVLALAIFANALLPSIELMTLALIAAILGLIRGSAQLTRT